MDRSAASGGPARLWRWAVEAVATLVGLEATPAPPPPYDPDNDPELRAGVGAIRRDLSSLRYVLATCLLVPAALPARPPATCPLLACPAFRLQFHRSNAASLRNIWRRRRRPYGQGPAALEQVVGGAPADVSDPPSRSQREGPPTTPNSPQSYS